MKTGAVETKKIILSNNFIAASLNFVSVDSKERILLSVVSDDVYSLLKLGM